MHISLVSAKDIISELASRGINVRAIHEYSMTELNNEITRRRMEAERTEVGMAEIYAEKGV